MTAIPLPLLKMTLSSLNIPFKIPPFKKGLQTNHGSPNKHHLEYFFVKNLPSLTKIKFLLIKFRIFLKKIPKQHYRKKNIYTKE